MRELALRGNENLARGAPICHHVSDGFADTQSLQAKTSPFVTLHFTDVMAEHIPLLLSDMFIFLIRLQFIL